MWILLYLMYRGQNNCFYPNLWCIELCSLEWCNQFKFIVPHRLKVEDGDTLNISWLQQPFPSWTYKCGMYYLFHNHVIHVMFIFFSNFSLLSRLIEVQFWHKVLYNLREILGSVCFVVLEDLWKKLKIWKIVAISPFM